MPKNDAKNAEDKTRRSEVVAVIPAHNEERFIGSVVLKALKFVDTVIVVDDGSSDATADIAEAAGAIVVRHARNMGKAAALNSGFREARKMSLKAMVALDGDAQHMPQEMPCLLAPLLRGEADIVVGSRYLGGTNSTPRHRVWGHRAMTFLTNIGSGVHVTDSQSGFRAFSSRAVDAMTFRSRGFSVESEMQFLAREKGLKVVEVPITIRYDEEAKRNVIAHGLEVLNGILRLVGQHRPLLFFGVPGMGVLLSGLLCGAQVVAIYRKTQELATGYALIAVLLCIVGSVALSTGLMLHSLRGLLLELVGPKE